MKDVSDTRPEQLDGEFRPRSRIDPGIPGIPIPESGKTIVGVVFPRGKTIMDQCIDFSNSTVSM